MPFKNINGTPVRSFHQLGSKGFVADCKNTSVSLGESGGDTHIHLGKDERTVVVTTRLRGGYEEHHVIDVAQSEPSSGNFNPSEEAGRSFRSIFGDESRDSSSEPKSSTSDFNPSEDAGRAFRSVFGDNNKP